jgi:DnaK suppressor protein
MPRPIQTSKFLGVLIKKRNELEKELTQRMEGEIQKMPDEMDLTVWLIQEHTEIVIGNGVVQILRQVLVALDRIKGGSFGTCLGCGNIMQLKRLRAIPWAPLCCKCQEQADSSAPTPSRRVLVHNTIWTQKIRRRKPR